MEEPPSKRNPAASLTDDLIVEILRRLPVRSVCRFKCVSRSWRQLISDPVHRKKLPQTLEGFFYNSYDAERFPARAHHFTNVTVKGVPFIYPSFSFLPVPSDKIYLVDSCNGLLLCSCYEPGPPNAHGNFPFHYAVCNPATERWVMLPEGIWDGYEARPACLGFDPKVSSHFHVIKYLVDEYDDEGLRGVEIFSSKTGAWSSKESEWGDDVLPQLEGRSVFLNGFMHVLTYDGGIIAVDMEGKTWRMIPIPLGREKGCIHQVQGHLVLVNVVSGNAFELSV